MPRIDSWLLLSIPFGLLVGALVAAPALSHDAMSPDEAAVETAADECPTLTRIKYPWLTCSTNAFGVKSVNVDVRSASWESEKRIPRQGKWIRRLAYYGPE